MASRFSSSLSQQEEKINQEVGCPFSLEIPEGKGENILTIANGTVFFSVFNLEGEMQSCFWSKNIETNDEMLLLSLDNLYMFSNRVALTSDSTLYFVMPDASTYCATSYNEIYEAQNRIVCFDIANGTGQVVKTYSSGDLLTYPVVLDESCLALNTSVCGDVCLKASVSIYTPADNSLVPVITKELYRPGESVLWSSFRSSAPPEGMKGEAIHCIAAYGGELYLLVSQLSGDEGQKPDYRIEIYSPERERTGTIPLDAFGDNSYVRVTILPQAQTMQVSENHIFLQTFSSQAVLLDRTGRESVSVEPVWRGEQGGLWEGESLSNPQVLLRSADGSWLLNSETGEMEKIGVLSPNAVREYGRRDGNRALVYTNFETGEDSWAEELYYADLEEAIRLVRERKG